MSDQPNILLCGAAFPPNEGGHHAARTLLALAVRDAWGWDQLPPIVRGKGGKPQFSDFPARHFNLSHTAGLCLCALSETGEVGVDIERVRPRREGLPQYVMSAAELAAFDGSWEDFTRVWTLKEAYCKLWGGSIFPPKTVPTPPTVPYRSYAGDGWRAALCAEAGELPGEISWVDLKSPESR